MNKEISVTTPEDLRRYSKGTIVELPPFASQQPFFARLRRPSLMSLIRTGKIPNSLMLKAQQLFNEGSNAYREGENSISEIMDILDILCESMFVEPTYKEINESGISLTDDQYIFLFNYSQSGVKALEPFSF